MSEVAGSAKWFSRSAPRCITKTDTLLCTNFGTCECDAEVDNVGHLVRDSLKDCLHKVPCTTVKQEYLIDADSAISTGSVTNGCATKVGTNVETGRLLVILDKGAKVPVLVESYFLVEVKDVLTETLDLCLGEVVREVLHELDVVSVKLVDKPFYIAILDGFLDNYWSEKVLWGVHWYLLFSIRV